MGRLLHAEVPYYSMASIVKKIQNDGFAWGIGVDPWYADWFSGAF
jgi:hypothetical protein